MGNGVNIHIEGLYIRDTKIKEEKERGPVMVFELTAKLDLSIVTRLWNLRSQGVPLLCDIGSPQAMMDLVISQVNIETGEVKHLTPALAGGAR